MDVPANLYSRTGTSFRGHGKSMVDGVYFSFGGAVLVELVGCKSEPAKHVTTGRPLTNWAGNLEYSTGNVHYPKTVEEIQQVVKRCNKLKALGSRHSFSKIADSNE